MLNKLLKYEFKATARTFLPLYGALIVMAFVNKMFASMRDYSGILGFSFGVSVFLYATLIMVMFALTFFVMVQRFYKNLIRDEGYLMHTLPVPASSHIFSKMITSVCWIFSSTVVTILSAFIIAFNSDTINQLSWFFNDIMVWNGESVLLILESLVAMLVAASAGILFIYTCLCIGQLFNKHKILAAFGAYLVLSTAIQFISFLLVSAIDHLEVNYLLLANPFNIPYLIMGTAIVTSILVGTAAFFTTNYILTKKLNLE